MHFTSNREILQALPTVSFPRPDGGEMTTTTARPNPLSATLSFTEESQSYWLRQVGQHIAHLWLSANGIQPLANGLSDRKAECGDMITHALLRFPPRLRLLRLTGSESFSATCQPWLHLLTKVAYLTEQRKKVDIFAVICQFHDSFSRMCYYLKDLSDKKLKTAICEAEVIVLPGSRLRDWILLLVCNLIWGSQFVLVKIVQEQMGPVFATFFPITIAAILLMPIVHRERRRTAANEEAKISRREVGEFVLLGVCGQVVAQLFITWGVRLSLASNAALLMLVLPVSTAIMAYFFLGERMTAIRWISFILAIAGVLECSGINWSQLNFHSSKFLLGNLMIFLSVNGSAFYNSYSKKMLGRFSPLQVLLYSYYAVFLFMLPITLYSEPRSFQNMAHFTPVVWLGLALLAVFQYLLSMLIFLNVLTRLDATQAGLCNYLIPFFGVVIAALVLHERLTPYMILGGILVLASTLLITLYEERKRTQNASATPIS